MNPAPIRPDPTRSPGAAPPTAPAAADPVAELRAALLQREQAVPTSRLGRLWRTGRGAAGMATAVLGGRLRGRGDGLAAADLDAVVRLVTQLGELKGVAMKAGQILSYIDPTLPPELRGLLSLLQTTSPATPFPAVEATLRQALGPRAEVLLRDLTRQPVAVASIGQVHRARLPGAREGRSGPAVVDRAPLDVAVKVRHPGIAEALAGDFRTAGVGAAFAGLLLAQPAGAARGFVDEAQAAMLEECDLSLEAERQATFGRLFAADPTLVIPAVEREYCAESVLTTRWTPGRSLDQLLAGAPSQATRDRLGAALFSFYIGALYRHGLFHADPHPGNYAFLEGDRVVIYDFGCVRAFAPAVVASLRRLVIAVRAEDEDLQDAALAALGAAPPRDREGRAHLRTLLRGFFAPLLIPGPRPMDPGAGFAAGQMMRDKRALMALALPGQLLFLFRLRFGLYAVLARLGAVADWAALESAWADGGEPSAGEERAGDSPHVRAGGGIE